MADSTAAHHNQGQYGNGQYQNEQNRDEFNRNGISGHLVNLQVDSFSTVSATVSALTRFERCNTICDQRSERNQSFDSKNCTRQCFEVICEP